MDGHGVEMEAVHPQVVLMGQLAVVPITAGGISPSKYEVQRKPRLCSSSPIQCSESVSSLSLGHCPCRNLAWRAEATVAEKLQILERGETIVRKIVPRAGQQQPAECRN